MDPITSVVTAVALGASAELTDTAMATVTDAAAAWNNLGLALRAVRRFEEAITACQRDIAICAQLGDRYGQAQTLGESRAPTRRAQASGARMERVG